MEAKIARGRVLRDLLKQDRLSPLPIEFHLAWLTGFNQGQFDKVLPESIPALLEHLAARVKESGLTLEDGEEEWTQAVGQWLREHRSL